MNTKKLRQKILDLAIHGKLVPQDPNDEPASVLLERIKAEKERLIKEGKIKKSKKSAKTSDTPHYGNVPFEVPEGWVWTTFGNVCKKLTDGSHNPPPKCSNGYTVISAQNIKNGKIVFTDKDRYTDELGFQKENPRTQITNGDIILGIIGGSIGNVAIYDLSVPVIAQRSISIIDTYVSNIYCFYLLQSTIFQSLFLEKSIGNAQAGVYLGELDKLYIPLPPLAEQNRITAEIERWFALIDQIEQGKTDLQTTIKQTKSKILNLAIHGKLVQQDPNDEPAIELLKRINPDFTPCDNGHYQQLPDGWCFCSLESLCSFISRGKSPKYSNSDRTYPVFAQKCNLKDGEISLEQAKFLDPSTINKWPQKYRLRTGDVLINSTGTGTVGRTRLFNQKYLGGYPFVVPDSHVSVIRTYDKICSEYVYTFLSSSSSQQFLEENLAGSTNQKELYIDVLKDMVISLPPYQEQLRIVSAVQKTFVKLDMIKESL